MSTRPAIAGDTLDFFFNTEAADGTAVTLAGSPTFAVYKANGTTESTAGVSSNIDFDGRTGMHHVRVVTTDAFYTNGSDYQLVLTAGTVDGQSKAGAVLARFFLGHAPANVTQWRGTQPAVLADTDKVPASTQHMANNVLTNAAINDGAISVGKIADNAITSAKLAANAIGASQIASSAITDTKIASNAITSAKIAASAIGATQIASNAITDAKINTGAFTAAKFASGAFDAVWTVSTRTLTSFGTLVADVAAAVWAVATSGLTTAGTIGKLIVDNLNATVGSRAAETGGNVAAARTAAETVESRLTSARAGYIDNLNVGGPVASQTSVDDLGSPVQEDDARLDKLNVTGTLANTDNADDFKADVSGLSTFDPAALDLDGYDLEEALRVILAATSGKLSGANPSGGTIVIRSADDSKPRITAACDRHGNRTTVTIDATPSA